MATRVDRWLARDGREFQTEAACEAHDKWLSIMDCMTFGVEDRQAISRVYGLVKNMLENDVISLGPKAQAYYEERKKNG